MKAAYINKCGAPDEIIVGELPVPEIAANQVLVRVEAVTVDPIDTYIRSGTYKLDLPSPFIIGRDMIGVVEKVGSNTRGFAVGDHVWCNNQGYAGRQGTFAEFIAVEDALLYKLPPTANAINVLCSVHSALTAVVGLIGKAKLSSGQKLFINGGSGNVGNVAIQLAKHLGATVATTAGNEEKIQWCKENGADLVINYRTENIDAKLKEFAPEGLDVYWELTKSADVERAVQLSKHRGIILLSAGAAAKGQFSVGAFYTHNLSMYGFTITELTVQELAHWAGVLNELFAQNVFKSKVAEELKLADAGKAHQMMEGDALAGKLVLTI